MQLGNHFMLLLYNQDFSLQSGPSGLAYGVAGG